MHDKPLSGKKVAVLVETEFIHDEIEYYKRRVPELGGELHLLSYLWDKPQVDLVNDILQRVQALQRQLGSAGSTPDSLVQLYLTDI
jgi:protease I